MTTEESTNLTETTEEKPKAQPLLPDGIGLTVEQVSALIHQVNHFSLPPDDPALMYVTIMNAALTEQAKLQKAHQSALGKMMDEHTQKYVQETEKGMKEILFTLSKLTTEGLNEASKDMVKFRTTLWMCSGITFISALLIVCVFVLK